MNTDYYCSVCQTRHQFVIPKCYYCGKEGTIIYDGNASPKEIRLTRSTQKPKDNCFVATAAYGNYNAPEVLFLREFRDKSLNQSLIGQNFITFYYAFSPYLAQVICKSTLLKILIRKFFIEPLIVFIKYFIWRPH